MALNKEFHCDFFPLIWNPLYLILSQAMNWSGVSRNKKGSVKRGKQAL